MTEVKHTPGPWKIVRHMGFGLEGVKETDDPECQMGFAGPNGERVCWFGQSADYYPTEGDEPSEADARLMVASPDLLIAIKALLLQALQSTVNSPENEWGIEALELAVESSARAEGRA